MTRIFLEMVKRAKVEALGVAMPGARLPERVRQIVDGGVAPRISRARLAVLAAACVAMCGAFAVGNVARARQDAGQSNTAAEAASGERPKFDVASVRPCKLGDLRPPPSSGGGRGGGGGGDGVQWSPGRLTLPCTNVRTLVDWAYVGYADGKSHSEDWTMVDMRAWGTTIEGLPSWGGTERFIISAEVPGDASREMMMGPMLQSLLEDRFALKIHAENRDVPAYELRVAKGGPKLPEPDNTICRTWATGHPEQRIGPANLPDCNWVVRGSMANFTVTLRGFAGNRPVIDKTGLEGDFDIHIAFAPSRPPGVSASDDLSNLPTIFDALKDEVGLELVPAKGTDRVLVVDHIEEPTPN